MTDSLRNRPQGTGAIWGFATRVSDDAEGIVALRGSAMISLRDVVISLAIRSPNLGLAVRRRMSQTFFQATYMKDSVLETEQSQPPHPWCSEERGNDRTVCISH
jgi:hypothetical protein